MHAAQILVVPKTSRLDIWTQRGVALDGARRHGDLWRRIVREADATAESLSRVGNTLRALDCHVELAERPSAAQVARSDLLLTVGGDGTLLRASRLARATPVLGVNACPEQSVGHFCGATAETLGATLERWLDGALAPIALERIHVRVAGRRVAAPVLNDVLIAHPSPAATTRYTLRAGGRTESQISSGLWIATAAGSTAAIQAAGGRPMPPTDRRMQLCVREPLAARRYRLISGLTRRPIEVRIDMEEAALFCDGNRRPIRLVLGDVVHLSTAAEPLRLCHPGWH